MGALDLAILDNKSVPLGAVVAKEGRGVKVQLQSLGELAGRVTQEADLTSCQLHIPRRHVPVAYHLFGAFSEGKEALPQLLTLES